MTEQQVLYVQKTQAFILSPMPFSPTPGPGYLHQLMTLVPSKICSQMVKLGFSPEHRCTQPAVGWSSALRFGTYLCIRVFRTEPLGHPRYGPCTVDAAMKREGP